jgi:hypothetical protein
VGALQSSLVMRMTILGSGSQVLTVGSHRVSKNTSGGNGVPVAEPFLRTPNDPLNQDHYRRHSTKRGTIHINHSHNLNILQTSLIYNRKLITNRKLRVAPEIIYIKYRLQYTTVDVQVFNKHSHSDDKTTNMKVPPRPPMDPHHRYRKVGHTETTRVSRTHAGDSGAVATHPVES